MRKWVWMFSTCWLCPTLRPSINHILKLYKRRDLQRGSLDSHSLRNSISRLTDGKDFVFLIFFRFIFLDNVSLFWGHSGVKETTFKLFIKFSSQIIIELSLVKLCILSQLLSDLTRSAILSIAPRWFEQLFPLPLFHVIFIICFYSNLFTGGKKAKTE